MGKLVEWGVPELCRFFGIIIRMFVEVQSSHHTPHFHAYYQEHVAVYGRTGRNVGWGIAETPAALS
jgi:hypothetical protein